MPFEGLPHFPQGGAARADSGVPGIPPESFQQALRDSGTDLIESTKRPEDHPSVAAAMTAEVDTLAAGLGHPQPQPTPTEAPAPAPPETQARQEAPSPFAEPVPSDPKNLSDQDLRKRVETIMQKYDGDPKKIAKAYYHTDVARTQAQQASRETGQGVSALQGQVGQMQQQIDQLTTQRYAGPQPPAYFQPQQQQQQPVHQQPQYPAPGTPQGQAGTVPPEDSDDFFKNPLPLIRNTVNEVVQSHLMAYTDAQRQADEQKRFAQMQIDLKPEIERLRPIMNEVYMEDQWLFESLSGDKSLQLLLKRAGEREEAMRARQYHEEIRGLFGREPPPPQTGTLPTGATSHRTPGTAAAVTDWSNTPRFNKLWKARSDSVDEHSAIADILEERGFGENR